jgi:hypothetical protein
MTIPDHVAEPILRSVLHAVIRRDIDAVGREFEAAPNDETRVRVAEIALLVAYVGLGERYANKPDAAQLRALAEEIAGAEAWSTVDAEAEYAFLRRLLAGQLADDPDEIAMDLHAAFVTAGYLMVSHCRPGEKWWEHLDRIEAVAIPVG